MTSERTDVELNVLEDLRPGRLQLEILGRLYKFLERKLGACLARKGYSVVIEVEGSYAKGTLLSDKWEVDMFTLFNDVSENWIRESSLQEIRDCIEPLPYTIKYAEHPYLKVTLMGLEVEVIPALKVEKPRGGLGVERTPFHTRYVKSKLEKKPFLADDIMLLKSFMMGVGVYGAESGIGGFSGYLTELLVIYYGGFLETLRASLNWKPQVYIDPEGLGDERRLRSKYGESPLIVVDPVDPERNTAASVTLGKLSTFMLAAALYLKRPHRGYFHLYSKSELPKSMGPALLIECRGDYDSMPEENVMGKLRRATSTLHTILNDNGFKAMWSSYTSDFLEKTAIITGLESLELPELEYRRGPAPWDSVEGAVNFIFKRLSEGGVVWVGGSGSIEGVRRRRYRRAYTLVLSILDRIRDILDARECTVIECGEGVACLEKRGLKMESLIGGPQPAWARLAYTLLKQD